MGTLTFENVNAKLDFSTEMDKIVGESFENSDFEYQGDNISAQSITFISLALGCV